MDITIEIYKGRESINYIETVSQLRICAFKEFPYLYEGNLEREKKYMQHYSKETKSTIAIAKHKNEVIGISTGIPLMSETEIVADARNIFLEKNININNYYYYGEVIVLPKYRRMSLTKKMYTAQDNVIKKWGFNYTCILTVIREHNHPLKPTNYIPLDKMWEHLGFIRNNLTIDHAWPTIQTDKSVVMTNNTLEFWTKKICNESL